MAPASLARLTPFVTPRSVAGLGAPRQPEVARINQQGERRHMSTVIAAEGGYQVFTLADERVVLADLLRR